MSWGVATQNGVSVSLASIVSLSCGATEFSPASLFTSGVQGAWYDPSDYSTLFQDSAGTTPVTAVEQPVGLMLDKSQGLVLGSELFESSTPSGTGWTGTNATASGNVVTFSAQFANRRNPTAATSDKWYRYTFTARRISGNTALQIFHENSLSGDYTAFTATGTATTYQVTVRGASGGTINFGVQDRNASGFGDLEIYDLSVKELAGNHASQATTASRPVLRARYNQLTYSEQFDNAAWAKRSAGTVTTVTANTTVAPDGTLTADTISDVSTSDYAQIDNGSVTAGIANTNYTFSLYVLKDAVTSRFPEFLLLDNTNSLGVCIQLNTSTGAVANRTVIGSPTYTTTVESAGLYWRLIHTIRTGGSATTLTAFIRPVMSATLGGAVDTSLTGSIVVWGADLRTGSSAGTYQRIAASTDYATAGFLPYLALSTDDSMATGSIDFTATDKMSVCTGVTKLGDTATGTIASTNSSGLPGYFEFFAPSSTATNDFAFRSIGTLSSQATSAGSYAAPITCVLTGRGDISGDSSTLRLNGSQIASNSADQGTGNYGLYPLQIGRRGGFSLPFNGNIYQLIVCGKTLSASELASTEAYVNSKTGAY